MLINVFWIIELNVMKFNALLVCSFLSINLLVVTPVMARNQSLTPITEAQKSNPRFIESSIRVRKFRLRGFTEISRLGITEENIQAMLLKWLEEDRGLATFDSLQNIAYKLTGFYRDSGLTFHRAILPPQEVRNKTVLIRIVSGKLADVHVRGHKKYSDQHIKKTFKNLVNQPVIKSDIEEALLLLNDSPGIETFAYFSKARGRGKTRVNIKVTQEKSWQGQLRMDNYGSESTGLYRTTGRLSWLNPTGSADQIDVGLMQSAQPENNLHGSLSYKIPLFSPRFLWSFRLSNNQFDVGDTFESLELSGESKAVHMELSYKSIRSFKGDRTLGLYLDQKKSTIGSEVIQGLLDDEEKALAVGLYWKASSTFWDNRVALSGLLDIYAGQYDSQLKNISGQFFNKTSFSYNLAFRILQSQTWLANTFRVSLRGQYSDTPLASFEQFSLSGPSAVRAAEAGSFSADRGGIATAQWYWQPPKISYLSMRPYVFMDHGMGEQVDDSSKVVNKSKIQGKGLGLDIQLFNKLTFKLEWAQSNYIKQGLELIDLPEKQSRFLAELNVPFN
jgi:hemolysin activation/secretion protein